MDIILVVAFCLSMIIAGEETATATEINSYGVAAIDPLEFRT